MNSRAKAFEPSISAAARLGQKMASPRRWNSSAMPSTMGSSGPTTVRSALMVWAKSATSTMFEVSMGTQSARPADPGVAGRAVDLLHQRALADLPDERVLAAAIADDQDLHRRRAHAPREAGKSVTPARTVKPAAAPTVTGARTARLPDILRRRGRGSFPSPRSSTSPRAAGPSASAAGCATPRATSSRSTCTRTCARATPRPTSGYWVFPLPEGDAETTIGIDLTTHRAGLAVEGDAASGREPAVDSWSNPDYVFDPVIGIQLVLRRGRAGCVENRFVAGKVADPEVLRSYYHRVHAGHGYTPAEPFLFELHAAMLRKLERLSWRTSRAGGRVLDAGCGRSLFTEIRPRLAVQDRGRRRGPRPPALAPGGVPATCAGWWRTRTRCPSATPPSTRSSRES